MTIQKDLLSGLWQDYPASLVGRPLIGKARPVAEHLAEVLAIGPFYHYIINGADHSLHHSTDTILSIHGLNLYPENLQQMTELIHPDDMDFVIAAEKAALEKIQAIGLQYRLNLKTSYCFRMRMSNGSYHLFNHQKVLLGSDEEGRVTATLHIHTDIQHITQANNKMVLINGIGKRKDLCKIDISGKECYKPVLSRREAEVLMLLGQGFSSRQIADKLFISPETVRVHRKHLLQKTGTTNCSSLISKCAKWRLV